MTYWLNDQPTNRPSDQPTDRLIDWLADVNFSEYEGFMEYTLDFFYFYLKVSEVSWGGGGLHQVPTMSEVLDIF